MRYYRSLIPTDIKLNIPRFDPHITVVRNETITDMTNWSKHDGMIVSFLYSTEIEHDETYWWLPVKSNILFTIRESLGLNPNPPWHNGFHITIGNTKAP